MKAKILYISVLAVFSVGFYLLGTYTRQPVVTSTNIDRQIPDLDPRKFYSSFSDGPCPFVNTPDTEACITKLADSTLAEADSLAYRLLQSLPENNTNQFIASYYDSLHTNVLSAQKAKDTYFEAACGLNGLLSYGGTGMNSDVQSCRYYYAQVYLSLLKSLDKPIKHL